MTKNEIGKSHSQADAQRRVGKNFVVRIIGRIISICISIITMAMLGRYLGEIGYGEYAFWYSLIFTLQMFGDLGLQVIIVREIAKHRNQISLLFGDAIILKVSISALFFMILLIISFALPKSQQIFFLIIGAASIVGASQDISIWVFRGIETMEYEAFLTIFSQILWISLICFFISMGQGIALFLSAQLIASLARTFFGFLIVKSKGIKPEFSINTDRFRKVLSQSIPVGAAFIVAALYNLEAIFLLRIFAGPKDVASYSVGATITFGFLFIAVSLTTSAFPVFSQFSYSKREALPAFYSKVSKYLLTIAVPITITLIVLSDEVISLMFKKGFEDSIISLRMLSLGLAFGFMNRMYRFLFPAINRQVIYLRIEIFTAVLLLIVCLSVIPAYGFKGAILAFLCTELVKFLTSYLYIRRKISPLPFVEVFCKPITAGLFMALVLFSGRGINLYVILFAGFIIYLLGLTILKIFSREEIEMMKQTILMLSKKVGKRVRI
ncbi:MAG: flippase [Desulfobacteraceae bacterium]|nr:flippase [Desulfobacteraceae bacterium]MBC2753941.1 flippase [Desulfobacteraceae bacterium]